MIAGESLTGRGPLTVTGAPGTSSVASVTASSVSGSPGAGLALDDTQRIRVTQRTACQKRCDLGFNFLLRLLQPVVLLAAHGVLHRFEFLHHARQLGPLGAEGTIHIPGG